MDKHLFNDLLSLILTERKNRYKSMRTAAWEKGISKRIFEYFEGKYIEDLSEESFNRFFSFIRFKENGNLYSDKYLKAVYSLIKAVCNKAVIKRYININPIAYDFKRPKGKATQARQRYISQEDLAQLLERCKQHKRLRFIIPILLLTGMRIGELLGLYWTDIDFENNIITIQRAVSDNFVELPNGEIVKRGVRIDTTKTEQSNRELPVSKIVIDLFKSMLEFRDLPENSSWKKKIENNNNLNLCFPNGAGRLTDYRTLYDTFMEFLKNNHLEKSKIMFHKLRHNYASDLLVAGVDIVVISQMLGHSNIETTVNTYIKDDNLDLKKSAIKRQNKLVSKYNISI